jgi:hypothetical protein
MAVDAMDEDALLQQALALSMAVDQAAATPAPSSGRHCHRLSGWMDGGEGRGVDADAWRGAGAVVQC